MRLNITEDQDEGPHKVALGDSNDCWTNMRYATCGNAESIITRDAGVTCIRCINDTRAPDEQTTCEVTWYSIWAGVPPNSALITDAEKRNGRGLHVNKLFAW